MLICARTDATIVPYGGWQAWVVPETAGEIKLSRGVQPSESVFTSGSLPLRYSRGRRGCPEIEQGCVIIGNRRRAARFPIIPTPGGGLGRSSVGAAPGRENCRLRLQARHSRLAALLRTATSPEGLALPPGEARGAAGKLTANRGPHLRLPASARTTGGHDANGLGVGSPV